MANLHFYYSAMNAGKTTTLLQTSYNYQERGMKTILLSPQFDSRSGDGRIVSRIGISESSYSFYQEEDLFEKVKILQKSCSSACVLVDEAHFLKKKQVMQLSRICDDLSLPVFAYGLRTDFLGEPFEGSQYLLALSDQLIELKTVCHCGQKATMNMRIDDLGQKVVKGKQIEFGGNERYIATCRLHFSLGLSGLDRNKMSPSPRTKVVQNLKHDLH